MNKISSQIYSLADEALKEIRQYLRDNGDIVNLYDNDDLEANLSVIFRSAFDGSPFEGCYDEICLVGGEIHVCVLSDYYRHTLHESELMVDHVLEIIEIINEIEQNK